MPYELKYNSTLRIIEIVHTGVLSAQDIRKSTAEAIALQWEYGAYAVLVDSIDLESVEHLTDVYDLPRHYEKAGVSHLTHIAVVLPRLRETRVISRFYDNVCNNRGWRVQPFETRDKAVAWLTASESS